MKKGRGRALLGEVGRTSERGTLRAWLDEHALGADPLPAAVRDAVEDLLLQDPDASGADLRVWLSTGGRGDAPLLDGDGAVALSTFHAAKGLEWPTVIVVGAVPGLVPHSSARTPRALDEERRLFHVAVARAQRDLIITWYGDEGSPWLAALDQASEAPSAPPPARSTDRLLLLVLIRWCRACTRGGVRRPERPSGRDDRPRRPDAGRHRRRGPVHDRRAG